MKLFDDIKKEIGRMAKDINSVISDDTKSKYNEIVNIHNELKKPGFTIKAKKNIYDKMINLLNSVNKDEFMKMVKKNSQGTNTPFGWYSNLYQVSVDGLINEYNEKIKHNNVYLENLDVFKNLMNKTAEHKIVFNDNNNNERKKLSDLDDIKISNITKSFNKEQLIKYVVIDVETTGLKAQSDEIVEISAIKIVDGDPIEYFSSLIKPKKSIPAEVVSINHITDDMVKDSPSIDSVIEDFDNFVEGCNIVGHNIAFDLKFLYCNGSKILQQKGIKIYDTVDLSRKVFKDRDNYKLDNICKENLQIMRDDAHRSLSDAFVTYYLFETCIELIASKN